MLKIHPENLAILIDFDGTITTIDTNSKLVQMYGNEKIQTLRRQFKNKEIDYLTLLKLQFREFKLNETEYIKFIVTEFIITEGFLEFYNNIKKNNITFAIISGGFKNTIIPFLKKYRIDDVSIYANSLIFNHNDISVKFHDEEINTECCGYGPCGNCKIRHYKNYKRKKDIVIFIGDGFTDYCVASIADVVFAKGSLLEYCQESGLKYIPWQDFNDINEIIFNRLKY